MTPASMTPPLPRAARPIGWTVRLLTVDLNAMAFDIVLGLFYIGTRLVTAETRIS
jgi:hypothetical protein